MQATWHATRLLASVARVNVHSLGFGALNGDDWHKLNEAMTALHDRPLLIDDASALVPDNMFSTAKNVTRAHGKLALIVVDAERATEVSRSHVCRLSAGPSIWQSLKELAQDFNCPVIAVSRVRRSVEYRSDKRPMLADVCGGDSMEAYADLVLTLYRDEIYDDCSADTRIAEISVLRNRAGVFGTVRLAFQPAFSQFERLGS